MFFLGVDARKAGMGPVSIITALGSDMILHRVSAVDWKVSSENVPAYIALYISLDTKLLSFQVALYASHVSILCQDQSSIP